MEIHDDLFWVHFWYLLTFFSVKASPWSSPRKSRLSTKIEQKIVPLFARPEYLILKDFYRFYHSFIHSSSQQALSVFFRRHGAGPKTENIRDAAFRVETESSGNVKCPELLQLSQVLWEDDVGRVGGLHREGRWKHSTKNESVGRATASPETPARTRSLMWPKNP